MDQQTDGWTDGWMDGRTDVLMVGKTDGWTDARTDGRKDRRTDTPSYKDAWTHLKTFSGHPVY